MKELQEILKKISQFNENEKAILATVVDVVGSGYRRPGARMLIDAKGKSIGTVSGGCLEADVLERAKKVLETGTATVITYDTTADENSVFGLGMGCRGIVRILLESVTSANNFVFHAADNLKERSAFAVATLIQTTQPDLPIGARLFFDDSGVVFSDFEREAMSVINNSVRRAFADQTPTLETFEFGEVFTEVINPPLQLLLFGAGFDALPLIRFAKNLGWRVSVIDHRAAYNNAERIPEADEIIVASAENLDENLFADENSVAVIMTHNYDRDRDILRRLLRSKCLYVGALGPKKRTEKLLEEIGGNFTDKQLKRLHAPIGLDIGADTPEEIALAVVAEIRSVLSGRNGGFLRERRGSIYNR
ncbi:MAG: XdhC family protein [Pyrinomonadaceae bacterium]|nr:XdhC family protein [Pyrinomonadaceae bacterium]